MSTEDSGGAHASPDTRVNIVILLVELQAAIVRLSVAAHAHLGALQRRAGPTRHHQELKECALELTARELEAATNALNDAFAPLRDQRRNLAFMQGRARIDHTTT